MMKKDEQEIEYSCWNRAKDGERLFILMARDIAAPATIKEWVRLRIKLHKNKWDDSQIQEALKCAELMEENARRLWPS